MASTPGSIWLRATVSLLVFVALVVAAFRAWPKPVEVLLREGQEQLVAGRFDEAGRSAERILRRDPEQIEALQLAGQARMEAGDPQGAMEFFNRIPDKRTLGAVQARCLAGHLLAVTLHDLSGAEDQFRRALKLDPQNEFANDQLGGLLGLTARSWEATPYRLNAVKRERAGRALLFGLALGDLAQEDPAVLQEYQTASPDDPAVLLALAAQTDGEQDASQSIDMLRKVIRLRPDWIEPHVRLGRLLLETNAFDEFATWQANLPKQADTHPGIWAVRGLFARQQGDERAAVRCLWESVRLDPNVQQSNDQLGQALVALGRAEEAEAFQERSALLQNYVSRAHSEHEANPEVDSLELTAVTEAAAELGLITEAYGWIRLALEGREKLPAADQLAHNLPSPDPYVETRCVPDTNPALQVDFSDFPLPEWPQP